MVMCIKLIIIFFFVLVGFVYAVSVVVFDGKCCAFRKIDGESEIKQTNFESSTSLPNLAAKGLPCWVSPPLN
jgi:hypothetical protein